jgi:phosphatidylglycerol:prolipoprotein diacylglycerol transferase
MRQIIVDFGTLDILGMHFALRIYGYGLMLVLGFLLGIYLARWRGRRAGEDPDVLSYCGILSLIGGIVGARIAYVIEQWDRDFSKAQNKLTAILNVTSGGLIYYGGVVLATAMVLVYLRFRKLSVRRYLDILAPSLMIGLAFGRAGCLLNGCCFGGACSHDWPLGMSFPMYSKPLIKLGNGEIPFSSGTDSPSPVYAHQMSTKQIQPDPRLVGPDRRLVPPRDMSPEQIAVAEQSWSNPVKPAQALATVNALLLAGVLMVFHRIRRREGQVFALLVILYPITRFIEEAIRDDNRHDLARFVFTHNQYTSAAILTIGLIMWFGLRKLPPSAGPTWSQRLEAVTVRSGQGPKKPHGR